MEGSSDSAWQQSDSFTGLSTSRISDRNQRHPRPSRSGLSLGNVSNDSGNRKARDEVVLTRNNNHKNQVGLSGGCDNEVAIDPYIRALELGNVSLRQWLDKPERSIDAFENSYIFSQIVEIVNIAHSQGIVVHNVRPSFFVVSPYNRVSFIESASCSDSVHPTRVSLVAKAEENSAEGRGNAVQEEEKKQPFPMKQILLMETNWYTSPEEAAGASSSCASDIYQLGVLLFELFCPCSSREEKSRTMFSLRHRLLPPQLLLQGSKEAAFCLWLLHPEPASRPKMCELLQSEFLNEPREDLEEQEAAIELQERIEEQEVLLEFLLLLHLRKQEVAEKLRDTISFLCSDIEEVTMQQMSLKKKAGLYQELENVEEYSTSKLPLTNVFDMDGSRLMKNFKKLESTYFLTRCRPIKQLGKPLLRQSLTSSAMTERNSDNSASKEQCIESRDSGWINPFLEGLCKYHSCSKFKVKAELNQGDLLNSSNLVCALDFDCDGEFFATAGVNRKIKVFECDTIISRDRDIFYPVVEMVSESKLSSICWNSYIKSQIASSNFEGVVQVWDVTKSQLFMEMREHERRVWSIDFSSADPTMLASGSDDGSVKLWSINQGVSIGTIKTKANVCSVQFPLDSARSLAFGSADHKIYYYDLRNTTVPLCTLVGHDKTVSYVKFVDTRNLVSSSTDNTLKLWDLSTCTSRVIDTPVQSFTGHTNMKNFVGLSVSDGYIATGSETNEVFVYHKAFPMPALSFKFNNTDSFYGNEVDDAAQFISSVCWRGQSPTLVAANSSGNIKILEMV